MSKFIKIASIILLILLIFFGAYTVQATEEKLDSEDTLMSEENVEESSNDALSASNQVSSTLDALSASSVTKVSTVNSYDQANLQLNNILSIILISIGVLLILFAIAILIRLKK